MEHKTTHEEKQRQSEEALDKLANRETVTLSNVYVAPLKVGWDGIHLLGLGNLEGIGDGQKTSDNM